jgi:hypothetical protein
MSAFAPLHLDLVPIAGSLCVICVGAKVAVLPGEPNLVMGWVARHVEGHGALDPLGNACRFAAPQYALAGSNHFGHNGSGNFVFPFPLRELRAAVIELKLVRALVDDDDCDSSRSQVSNGYI